MREFSIFLNVWIEPAALRKPLKGLVGVARNFGHPVESPC